MPRSKTGASAIRAAERREKAVELRLAGATYRGLAKVLGVSLVQIQRDLTQAMAELAERTCTEAEKLRAVESERLYKMIGYSWKAAQQGDQRSIANIVRISESLRRLWGLDAPERKELTGADGGPLEHGLTPESADLIRRHILGIDDKTN
jgi:hypothetical protein